MAAAASQSNAKPTCTDVMCRVNEDRIEKLEKRVDEHDDALSENKAQFATITTKLNMIMGILTTIGAGLAGIIINMIFK